MGKDTTKTGYFSHLVGNIDHLLCLGKLEHPYESRIRQQYLNVVLPDTNVDILVCLSSILIWSQTVLTLGTTILNMHQTPLNL